MNANNTDTHDSILDDLALKAKRAGEQAADNLRDASEDLRRGAKNAGEAIRQRTNWDEISKQASETGEAVATGAKSVGKGIADGVRDASEAVSEKARDIGEAVKEGYAHAKEYLAHK